VLVQRFKKQQVLWNYPVTKKYVMGGLLSALLAVVGFFAWRSYVPHQPVPLDESARVEACEKHLQDLTNFKVAENSSPPSLHRDVAAAAAELTLISNIASMCYREVEEQDTLSEAGIRRLAFLNQQSALPVLMWMVMAITLSGVVLAGLQLVVSYQLALRGKRTLEQRSEISIEVSKISTNSSVSGVSILLISLAFFYIFVKQVYLISETTSDGAPVSKDQRVSPLLPGGAGAPSSITNSDQDHK
jgi:hypothetical protein